MKQATMIKMNRLAAGMIFLIALISCRSSDPLIREMHELSATADALRKEIDSLQADFDKFDVPYWKLMTEIEVLRHRVTAEEKDSIDDFYKNYVFRFRRPVIAMIEPDPSSPFRFPFSVASDRGQWILPVIWGRLFYFDYNHLGIDLYAKEGDTVYAVYDGIMRHYEAAGGYGELVAVIEHRRDPSMKNAFLPPVFLSIYGHLRDRQLRGSGEALKWKEGDRIRKGDIVGFINDDENNGDGGVHLHFGIRLQSAEQAKTNDSGRWLRGYDNRNGLQLRNFIDPVSLYGRYVQFLFP